MRPAARVCAVVLGMVLCIGSGAATATADPATRSGDPDLVYLQQTPVQVLRAKAKQARATYATTVKEAKAQRRLALAAPRATLATALETAQTKAQRRLAKRAYAKAAAPIHQDYLAAKESAAATRDAAIDEALADYLVATGKEAVADALDAYRLATGSARDTLELALKSGKETFKTDTADERKQLLADLEQAETEAERADAWKDFLARTDEERQAHNISISSARAAYRSALSVARTEFKAETGISIRSLLRLPFKI